MPLVEGMDKLHETFSAQQGVLESGELNIAAGESTILYLLPQTTEEVHPKISKIQIKLLNVTGGRDGLSRLRADEADFAVGPLPDIPDDIIYQPWSPTRPRYSSDRSPTGGKETVLLEEISPYPLILLLQI